MHDSVGSTVMISGFWHFPKQFVHDCSIALASCFLVCLVLYPLGVMVTSQDTCVDF